MKRVRLIISGDVQGVGYRAWMWQEAKTLGLMGWVMNRDDGAVEAVVEGEEENLKRLIDLCRKGPEMAWVEHINITWDEPKDKFYAFEIKY